MTRFNGRKYLKTIVDIIPTDADGNTLPDAKPVKTKVTIKANTETKTEPKSKTPAKKTETAKKSPAPATAAKATTDGDDLSKIYGIAKKAADALSAGGISSFEALAAAKVGDIRSIVTDAGAKLTADAKDIKKQATLAKNGKSDDLKALQAELKTAAQ